MIRSHPITLTKNISILLILLLASCDKKPTPPEHEVIPPGLTFESNPGYVDTLYSIRAVYGEGSAEITSPK